MLAYAVCSSVACAQIRLCALDVWDLQEGGADECFCTESVDAYPSSGVGSGVTRTRDLLISHFLYVFIF